MGRVVRGATCHGASCPWGELSMGRVGHGASCPWGELSMGRVVYGVSCLRASFDGASFDGASYLGASGPGTNFASFSTITHIEAHETSFKILLIMVGNLQSPEGGM